MKAATALHCSTLSMHYRLFADTVANMHSVGLLASKVTIGLIMFQASGCTWALAEVENSTSAIKDQILVKSTY